MKSFLAFQSPVSATSGPDRMKLPSPTRAVGGGSYRLPEPETDEFTVFESYNIDDWDGYGAKPITPDTVKAARAFKRLFDQETPQPDIAPGADGTIGFEWRVGTPNEQLRILIDVGPGGRVFARRVNSLGDLVAFAPTRVETAAKQLLDEIFSA